MRRLGLSGWILVGLAAGVFCGLFFGEACAGLKGFGDAFIGLLQMTVLPYIVLSLIGGIGSLDFDKARRLGGAALIVLGMLWGLGFAAVVIFPLALPTSSWIIGSCSRHTTGRFKPYTIIGFSGKGAASRSRAGVSFATCSIGLIERVEERRSLNMSLSMWFLASLWMAQGYEALPTYRAEEIVPAELRESDDYRVADSVTNDGFWNIYQIESEYGSFVASGNTLLRIRVREIAAIAQLKQLNEAKVLGEAAGQSLQDLGTSLATAVTQPKETVQGIGQGVKRLFGRLQRSGTRIGENVSASSDKRDGPGNSTARKVGKTGTSVGKSLLGIARAERRWAEKLGVDPYSRNAVLRKELNRIASFEAAGRITTSIVVPMPMVVSLSKDVSNLVWKEDPDVLETLNEERLKEMDVPVEASRALRLNENYSLTWETLFVWTLHQLGDAPGIGAFVARAAEARTEDEALFYTESAALLEEFHREKGTIFEIVPGSNAIAKLSGNRIAYLIPIDYMVWTEELESYMANEIAWMKEHHEGASIEVWLTGEMSARVTSELRARGWAIHPSSISVLVH